MSESDEPLIDGGLNEEFGSSVAPGRKGEKDHSQQVAEEIDERETEHNNQSQQPFWRVFNRQYQTMFRKDFLIFIRHPILLALEILIPALLFLTICGDPFKPKPLVTNHPRQELSIFDLKNKTLGYYPPNNPTPEQIYHLSGIMSELSKLYENGLDSSQLVSFQSEEQAKQAVLKCGDCFYAMFSVNVIDIDSLELNYTWRVHEEFITDLETGPTSGRLFDEVIAENMIEQAIVNYLITSGVPQQRKVKLTSFKQSVSLQKLADINYYSKTGIYNKIASGAPVILAISSVFSVFEFSFTIVAEKQQKLRQALHTVGLRDAAFWCSQFTLACILALVQAAALLCVGYASGYVYFRNSPFLFNLLVFLLAFLAAHTLAFLVSAFFSSIELLAFFTLLCLVLLFIAGTVCCDHKVIYKPFGGFSIWQMFYLAHASQAMYLASLVALPYVDGYFPSAPQRFTFADAAHFTGLDAALGDPEGYDCGHSAWFCIGMLALCTAAELLLASYVDLLFKAAHGRAMKFWEPFAPRTKNDPPKSNFPGFKPNEPLPELDSYAKAERACVLAPLGSKAYSKVRDSPIIIYQLNVLFKSLFRSTKHAVRDLSIAVPKNSIFTLLGANGAGKSTTMGVITGALTPSSGEVYIEGVNSLARQRTAQMVGYAPQFDIMWPDLTVAEHLRIYADLRGADYRLEAEYAKQLGSMLRNDLGADESLSEDMNMKKHKSNSKDSFEEMALLYLELLDLENKYTTSCKKLSGGMRRRLTLLLALVGGSPIIILDEITTGLDPISRRKVWNLLLQIKKTRTILLTTHSMQECDVLSDRIAILAHGALRTIGSSLQLKNRYGLGYRVDVECQFDPVTCQSDVLRIREIVEQNCANAVLVSRTGGHLTLAVSKDDGIELEQLLKALENNAYVKSWGIRQTTLEEVFLEINKQADKIEHIRELMK